MHDEPERPSHDHPEALPHRGSEALPHRGSEALPHRGFPSLDAPAGSWAAVLTRAQRRRARRAQLTAGLAAVVAVALLGGVAAVSGLRTGEEQQALLPAVPPRLAESPFVPDRDSPVLLPTPSGSATELPSLPTSSSTSGGTVLPTATRPTPNRSAPVDGATRPSAGRPTAGSPTGVRPPPPVSPAVVSGPACTAVSGRAVDTAGAPVADLVVARFAQGDGGAVEAAVVARTGADGRFSVPEGGSLLLTATAPGAAQTRATRNLVPVWLGGGSFPANPVGCGAAGDTVLVAGAVLLGDYAAATDGQEQTRDSLRLAAATAGSPLAVSPAVAAVDDDGYRIVGLPALTDAELTDGFDNGRTVDVTAGSTRQDWNACVTCLGGKPIRGGAAQVDPTDPPDLPDPTASEAPPTTPTPTAPSPPGPPSVPPAPTGPVPTGPPTTPPSQTPVSAPSVPAPSVPSQPAHEPKGEGGRVAQPWA